MKFGEIGNYNTYYKKRPLENDNRLSLILACPLIHFTGKLCLDIGCNEGAVTLGIAENCSPRCIIGIDPDKRLIESAKSRVKRIVYGHKRSFAAKAQKHEEVTRNSDDLNPENDKSVTTNKSFILFIK